MASPSMIPSPHDEPLAIQPGWRTITEGAAVVWYPGPDAVFYNKVCDPIPRAAAKLSCTLHHLPSPNTHQVQIFNRDLTMAVTRVYDAQRRAQATPRDVHKACMRRDLRRQLAASAASAQAVKEDAPLALAPAPPTIVTALAVPDPSRERHGAFQVGGGDAAGAAAALPGLRILEALSASGLRSIRCAGIFRRSVARG